MNGFLLVVGVCVWLAALIYSGIRAMEEGEGGWTRVAIGWAVAATLILVVPLGFVANKALEEENEGPCLRHETGYTLVGKVMTPYTYCAERGEWVK